MAGEHARQNFLEVHHSGQMIPDRIPTATIKKYTRDGTASVDTVRSSYIPTAGQVGILTYFHAFSTSKASATLALVDRRGTFDRLPFGTAAEMEVKERILQGDMMKPIHILEGTFSVYNVGGSIAGSGETLVHSWEVIKI